MSVTALVVPTSAGLLSKVGDTVAIGGSPVRVERIYHCMRRGFQQVVGFGNGKEYQWIEWLDGKHSKVFNRTDRTFKRVST